jgi:molecular chaperone GrpE
MADKEHEIPVKVIDRRWWVNRDASAADADRAPASLKPTYVEELEQQIAAKDRHIQEHIAKYRQAATEFEDARLRLRREISKDVERSRREVIAQFLEVLDNLDRAIDSGRQTSASLGTLLQGVEMVRRQFLAKLEALGVTQIQAAEQPFDPALHEAITTVPAASLDQDGIVVGVIRHGYRIGADVLRPASVAVAKAETLTP